MKKNNIISQSIKSVIGIMGSLLRPGKRLRGMPRWRAGRPIWAPWSTEKAIQEGLKRSVWVYACCRKLALAASSVPWIVEELKSNGKWERVEGHPIEILLAEPNNKMSGQDLFERLTYHLYLGGNGLWHMILFQGVPIEMWPISPDKIKPVPGENIGDIEFYLYKPVVSRMTNIILGDPIKIPPEQIAHFQFVDPSNIYWGLAPLQAAAMIVDTDVEAVTWNKIALGNRAVSDGVFSFKHPLTDDQWIEAKKHVSAQHGGPENAREPWVLGADADWKSMSMTPVEMDFLASRQWTPYEICAVFGVDPLTIGVPAGSARANKKEARRALWEDTIIPYLDDLKSGLNLQLIKYWDPESLKPNVTAKLRINYDLSNVTALKEILFEKMRTALGFSKMGVPFDIINQRLEMGFPEKILGGDLPLKTGQSEQGELSTNNPKHINYKSENKALTEQEKTIYWKSYESDRQKWEEKTVGIVQERLKDEERVVTTAYGKNGEKGALAAIESQEKEWETMFKAIFTAIVPFFAQDEINRLDEEKMFKKFDFDVTDKIVKSWITVNAAREAKEITDSSKEKIAAIINKGVDAQDTAAKISISIREQYKRWYNPSKETGIDTSRAMTISRTEINGSSGFGTWAGGIQTEKELDVIIVKTWITSRDVRVRSEHKDIDGQTRPIDERFSNGLMFNGDPSGSAKERINCRCANQQRIKRRQ